MREVNCSACTIFPVPAKDTPAYGLITNCMAGDGPLDAEILLLGEGPGDEEDRIGRPFQGRAGQKLNQILAYAGLDRKNIRVSNAVRCRPTKYKVDAKPWQKAWDNRPPTFEEITTCRRWLIEEITQMPNLKVIVALGNSPLASVLNKPTSGAGAKKGQNITSMRGSIIPVDEFNCHMMPTYHPAYILRNPSLERHVLRDFKQVVDFLSGKRTAVTPVHYHYFDTPEEAQKLFRALKKSGEFSFDSETTSKERFYGEKILSLTFSCSPYTAAYLPIWEGTSTEDSISLVNSSELKNYWVERYGQDVWEEVLTGLRDVFGDDTIKKVAHNAKFDMKFLRASLNTDGKPLDIRVNNMYFDTLIAHFVIDENSLHGLKELAEEYTDLGSYDSDLDSVYTEIKKLCVKENAQREKIRKILEYVDSCGIDETTLPTLIKLAKPVAKKLQLESVTTKTTVEEMSSLVKKIRVTPTEDITPHYGIIPVETIRDYSAKDADCTFRLYKLFSPMIEKYGYLDIFYNLRMPIIVPLLEAELKGFSIDVEETYNLEGMFDERRRGLEASIFKTLGRELNLASPKQLSEVLFAPKGDGGLGLKPLSKTKTGQASTNKVDLEKLCERTDNPVLSNIVAWRHYNLLIRNFLVGMREAIAPETGKVHPNFKITGTQTHRVVCENPNLLNIPRDDPGSSENAGSKIRNIFIPDNRHMTPDTPIGERHVFVDADLSQAELRAFASLSNDSNLRNLLESGVDLHAYFANKVFHKDSPLDDLSLFKTVPDLKVQRSNVKALIFGTIYGQEASGAEKKLGIPREEAQKIIDDIFSMCPDGALWIKKTREFAARNGYVVTPWGVRRHLPILLQKDHEDNKEAKAEALRQSVNSPVQTFASDYNCAAFVAVYSELKKSGIWFEPKVIVYDSILLECKLQDASRVSAKLYRAMTRKARDFTVKMQADISIVERWSGKEIDVDSSLSNNCLVFTAN